jgi:hypothetical protein
MRGQHTRIVERCLEGAPEILLASRERSEASVAGARAERRIEKYHLQLMQLQLLSEQCRTL